MKHLVYILFALGVLGSFSSNLAAADADEKSDQSEQVATLAEPSDCD